MPSLKRALADPEPSGPTLKKRRLRLALTTSPLSLPFSTPRTSSFPDRASSNRSKLSGINGAVRLSPWRRSSTPFSTSRGASSLLCKAAVLNRVQQRIDAACERNPNLRWEKERRQERELLLREGLEMRRTAALRDGLSPVNSTRPVVGKAVPPHSDPELRPAAALRLNRDNHDPCERRDADADAPPPTWCCHNGYPTPPASTCTFGLSNYDALDSEEEEKEKGGTSTRRIDANGLPVVDEGIFDIFDFLTPPAEHQTFLSFSGYGDDDVPETSYGEQDTGDVEDDEQSFPVPVDAGPAQRHCSFRGCQSAFRIPPQLTGNDAALKCIPMRNEPRYHYRHYAMPAFVAVPPAL